MADLPNLGPFQRLVDFNFSSTGMEVLTYFMQRNGPLNAMTLSDLPFGSSYNLIAAGVADVFDSHGRVLMQKLAPKLTSAEGIFTARGAVIFNLKNIRRLLSSGASFSYGITTPLLGGSQPFPGGDVYFVWFNFGDAFPGVPPFDHGSSISFDSAWGSLAEAEARVAILNVHSAYHVETESGVPTTRADFTSYTFGADTYRTRTDFPFNSNLQPQWDTSEVYRSFSESGSGAQPAGKTTVETSPALVISGHKV